MTPLEELQAAQIVYHDSRQPRAILRDGPDNWGDTITPTWRVPGQLWERVLEGSQR